MLAVAYFLLYIHCGMIMTFSLFPRKPVVVRCWLGACLGIALMMWLPVLFAFVWEFSYLAHVAAMALLIILSAAAYFTRDRSAWTAWGERDEQLIRLLLFVALPLSVVGGYLQWTHNIRPMADGTLHVGQSTYGDLPLHMGIISSLRNASFPPDYMDAFARDPLPESVIWDLSTRADSRLTESFYYLSAPYTTNQGLIRAKYDRMTNRVVIETENVNGAFSILLNERMIDFARPVTFVVDGTESALTLAPDRQVLEETTAERGDPNFQFETKVKFII